MAQINGLSKREREVVELVLAGKSNKEIASALFITESTVEFHLKNIYAKAEVSSRIELVLKLGQSTVADEGKVAENETRRNLSDFVKSLRADLSTIFREGKMKMMDTPARSAGTPMPFTESIRVCLQKYADFQGRASRPEFWWFFLFILLIASALALLNKTVSEVFTIATLLPLLAVGTRRLRDSGKSTWWLLFLLAPVGGIVLLGFLWAMAPVNPLPEDPPA
jgi:DNA-binding CsgD family transcriptional regulator